MRCPIVVDYKMLIWRIWGDDGEFGVWEVTLDIQSFEARVLAPQIPEPATVNADTKKSIAVTQIDTFDTLRREQIWPREGLVIITCVLRNVAPTVTLIAYSEECIVETQRHIEA